MYYIILDMEWNQALDRAHTVEKPVLLRGEIIQIGAVKCDEDFNLVDRLKINVAPKYYKKMNRHVEKITGITNAMLAKGEKFPEAFAKLREWCTPEFRFITWGFDDIAMLADNLELHGFDRSTAAITSIYSLYTRIRLTASTFSVRSPTRLRSSAFRWTRRLTTQ